MVAEIKIFTNQLVRGGSTRGYVKEFINHMTSKLEKEVEKAKSSAGKAKKEKLAKEFMAKIANKQNELTAAFDLQAALSEAKMPLIRKLEQIKTMGTFIKTDTGYRVTAPEGFVAVDNDGKAVKLVDRLEFSRTNFTVSKNWDKT